MTFQAETQGEDVSTRMTTCKDRRPAVWAGKKVEEWRHGRKVGAGPLRAVKAVRAGPAQRGQEQWQHWVSSMTIT